MISLRITPYARWNFDPGAKPTWLLTVSQVPWSSLLFMAMFMAFIAAKPLGRAVGLNELTVLVLVCVLVGASAIVWVLRGRSTWKLSFDPKSDVPDLGERVTLVATDKMLAQIGRPSEESFEPRVFRVLGAERGSRWVRWSIGVTCFFGMFVACSIMRGGGKLAWPTSAGASGTPWFFDVQAAIFAGYLPMLLLWPTYYRVVPGRLEILEFDAFGKRAVRSRKVELRGKKVLANAGTGLVRIEEASGECLFAQLLARAKTRAEFAKSVAEACVTPYVAPELPDDELVG